MKPDWTDDDKAEWEAALDEALALRNSAEQAARLSEIIDDARRSMRTWAEDKLDEAIRLGCAEMVKRAAGRRRRVLVAHNGRMLNRPAIRGVTARRGDGEKVFQRRLFIEMTFAEVEEVISTSTRHIRGEFDNIAVARKVLALADLAPGTETVAEACDALRLDLDVYLATEQAS